MRKAVAWIFCVVCLAFLGGCATTAPTNAAAKKEWQSSLVAGASNTYDKPLLQEHRGVMFQIRYAAAGKLMVRNLKTGSDALVWDGASDLMRSDGIASYSDGEKMYIAWRPKLNKTHKSMGNEGDKMVFVSSSANGGEFSTP
jgi:hypothetical protein